MKYLTIQNAKTTKGEGKGWLTGILYLAPANEAKSAGFDVKNACPFASAGCKALCLFTAGRGAFSNVRKARTRKSVELMGGAAWNERPNAQAIAALAVDIAKLVRMAKRKGMRPAVRLNGTSDYPVHNWDIMWMFPEVQFYDYTKDAARMRDYLAGKLPDNYHLTFSRSETNDKEALEFLQAGALVSYVFHELPKKYLGYSVKDGDLNDLTFTRGAGILGLRAKGKARKSSSGFVVK